MKEGFKPIEQEYPMMDHMYDNFVHNYKGNKIRLHINENDFNKLIDELKKKYPDRYFSYEDDLEDYEGMNMIITKK